jgi:hypothetical protein
VVSILSDSSIISVIAGKIFNFDSAINFDISIYFTDTDKNDELTFSVENLVSGLAIPAQGAITGSLFSSGSYSIKIIVTDSLNLISHEGPTMTLSELDSKSKSSDGYGLSGLLLFGLKRLR